MHSSGGSVGDALRRLCGLRTKDVVSVRHPCGHRTPERSEKDEFMLTIEVKLPNTECPGRDPDAFVSLAALVCAACAEHHLDGCVATACPVCERKPEVTQSSTFVSSGNVLLVALEE